MISKKANYMNESDEEVVTDYASEFLKTHMHTQKPTITKNNLIESRGFIVDLRRKVSREVLEKVKSSEVKYFVYLDEEEEEELKELFLN